MKKSYFFPITLIVIGVALLLNQFDLLELSRPYFFIVGFGALGAILLRKSYSSPTQSGLLGGTFFILIALIILSLDWGYIPFYDEVILGSIFIALGLSNFVYYLFTRKSFTNVTFGLIFTGAGIPFLLTYYGPLSYWELADAFATYWPVLLITAGFGFLIDGMLKKAK